MPTLHLRVGGIWTGQTPSPAVPGRTFVQSTLPVGAAPGDVWINPSAPAPAPQYFISGGGTSGAWQGNSGAKTFVQGTDPSLVPANGVKNGDIWTQPVSPTNPAAITSVRQGGAWVVGTPSIPESSRTFIQNTRPTGPQNGDLWINTSLTPPTRQYYYGAVAASPGVAAVAGQWHGDSGARTFVQDNDPATSAGGSLNPQNGDLWITLGNVSRAYSNGAWLSTATGGTLTPDFYGLVGEKNFQRHDSSWDSMQTILDGTFTPTTYVLPGKYCRLTMSIVATKYHSGWGRIDFTIPPQQAGGEPMSQTYSSDTGANDRWDMIMERHYDFYADANPIHYQMRYGNGGGINHDANVVAKVTLEVIRAPGTVIALP